MNGQPEYVFFTDRDLGKQFPKILRSAGIHVETHDEHFQDNVKDEEWLAEISKRSWFAITYDRRIRYKPNEIEAVKNFKIGLFILIGKHPFKDLANNFVNTLPKIEKFIRKNPTPFIAKVYLPEKKKRKKNPRKSGYVQMWVSFWNEV